MPSDRESAATLRALLRRPAAPLFDLVYRLYERELDRVIRVGPIPKHVGVILDGNRRFARKAGLSEVTDGHRRGADKVEELYYSAFARPPRKDELELVLPYIQAKPNKQQALEDLMWAMFNTKEFLFNR